jgi:hypothetical protein
MGFGSSTLTTCIALPLALACVFVAASCAKGADAEDLNGVGDSRDAASERPSLPPKGSEDPDGQTPPGSDGGKEGGGSNTTPACAAALAAATFDFESGPQGWTHGESETSSSAAWPRDVWGHGTATHGTPCAAGKCFGSELTQNYPQCSRGYLLSPTIDLSACKDEDVSLVFKHAFAFWSPDTSAFDGGILEISGNDGDTWQIPSGDYPGTVKIRTSGGGFGASCVPSSFYVQNKEGFVGTQTSTKDFEVVVPKTLLTAKMAIRFSMAAGVSLNDADVTKARQNTDFGWRIDDVHFVVK